MCKKILKYLSVHPFYNSTIHVVIGVGIGILIAGPFIAPHPVRWGVGLLILGLLGHVYPIFVKK